jgi:hypothetical protein
MSVNPSGLSDEEEKKFLELLQSQPDWESLPIPAYWFKKYGIPARAAVAPREYIESNYAMRRANEHKDLPPILIDEPQQNGKVYPVAPPEKVDIKVVSRPFVTDPSKPFPAVICPPHTDTPAPSNTPESGNPSSPRRMSQTEVSEERASLCE